MAMHTFEQRKQLLDLIISLVLKWHIIGIWTKLACKCQENVSADYELPTILVRQGIAGYFSKFQATGTTLDKCIKP